MSVPVGFARIYSEIEAGTFCLPLRNTEALLSSASLERDGLLAGLYG